MITVTKIAMTTSACPTQWEGTTSDGKDVYVRYRGGHLTIDIDGEEVFAKQCDKGMTPDEHEKWLEANWTRDGDPTDEALFMGMIKGVQLMCEINGTGRVSYAGCMKLARLKEETKEFAITWPEEESHD